MSLTFCTKNGYLYRDGEFCAFGYSGFGKGKNNPALQHVADVGPIPEGRYAILGPPFESSKTGKYVLRLIPLSGTNTFGRGGFEWHGDSESHPGEASHGCVVTALGPRQAAWQGGERSITVVTEPLQDSDMTPPLGTYNPFAPPTKE